MSLNVCVSHNFPKRARSEPQWEEHPQRVRALVHKKHGNVIVMVGSKWVSAERGGRVKPAEQAAE